LNKGVFEAIGKPVMGNIGLADANKESRKEVPIKETEPKDLHFTNNQLERDKQEVRRKRGMELLSGRSGTGGSSKKIILGILSICLR